MNYHGAPTAVTFLLVLASSSSFLDVLAQNACEDTWTYDSTTNTCFKYRTFKQDGKRATWTESRDFCRSFLGGSTGNKPGHLAKIGDNTTNTFVQELLPADSNARENWRTWIGLYYSTDANDVRWDGFPDEELTFTTPQLNLPQSAGDFVFIRNYKWNVKTSDDHPYVCQHYPLPETKITCPSSPMIEGNVLDQPMNFQYFRNTWTSLILSRDSVTRFTCIKGSQTCTPGNDNFKIDRPIGNMPSTSLDFNHGFTRNQAGTWKFEVFDSAKSIATHSCKIDVYEPPSEVYCNTVWTPSSLKVNCVTDKVFPEPTCVWFYKDQQDDSFQQLPDDSSTTSHEDYIDGLKYFKTTCAITLTSPSGNPEIGKAGALVFQAQFFMFATTGDPGTSAQANVNIESPDAPVFRHMDGSNIGSLLTLEEGDNIDLKCEITTGIPAVQETKVTCGFLITDTDTNTAGLMEKSSTDGSNQFTIKATRDMDGMTCVCRGKHITGETAETRLTLRVRYKATVKSFTINDTTKPLDVGDNFSLECLVAGNPLPSAAIFKHNGTEADQQLETVQASFLARCSDNGRYRCVGQNLVMGNIRRDEKEITVFVKCPPTPCEESQPDPVFVVKPGNTSVLSLCLVAYPAPKVEDFSLERANGQSWQEYVNNVGSIELISDSDILERVDIILNKIQPSDLGNFRLAYNDGEEGSSALNFRFEIKDSRLTEPEDGGGGGSGSGTIIGVVVAVVVVLIVAVVVVVFLMKRRKKMSNKNKDDDFHNLEGINNGKEGLNNNDVYANARSSRKQEKNVNLDQGKLGEDGIDNDATYFNENKENAVYVVADKPGSKGAEDADGDVVTPVSDDHTYGNVAFQAGNEKNKKKDNKPKSNGKAIQAPVKKSRKDKSPLNYIEVVIDPAKKKSVTVKENTRPTQSPATEAPASSPNTSNIGDSPSSPSSEKYDPDFDDAVEYSAINFMATENLATQTQSETSPPNEDNNSQPTV